MGRDKRTKNAGYGGRDPGQHVAIPHAILTDPAYLELDHAARSLLIEFALQFDGRNNGQLRASQAYLLPRGWKSADTINRAKRQLADALFIVETVKGARPNKASWYAITWQDLARSDKYDAGTEAVFNEARNKRRMRQMPATVRKQSREELYAKWNTQNTTPTPMIGVGGASIAPTIGVEARPIAPIVGAMRVQNAVVSTPIIGDLSRSHHLHGGGERCARATSLH